jgi:mono/diheme cytochrome c family protein
MSPRDPLRSRDVARGVLFLLVPAAAWVAAAGYRPPAGPAAPRPTVAETPLTDEQRRLFNLGRDLFATCSGCHGLEGEGKPGLTPPLAGSKWVRGRPGPVIAVLLNGLTPPSRADGVPVAMMPPAQAAEDDESVAAILTFIRRSWGNRAAPVPPHEVAKVREMIAARSAPYLYEELDAIP